MYDMSKGDAALLVSLFWTGFTLVRVLIIPLTIKLKSAWIVLLGQIVLSFSCVLLYSFHHDKKILQVGTFLFGFGLGPLYGGSLMWLTEHVTLRHEYLSLVLILTCIGAMVAVPIVSPLIEVRPIFLMQALNASSVLMITVLFTMVLSAKLLRKSKRVELNEARKKNGVDNPSMQVGDERVA